MITVNGKDLKSCNIAAELSRAYYAEAAEKIKAELGGSLNVVDISEAGESSIVIKHIEKVMGEESFRVFVKGSQLVIECAFDNMLVKAVEEFLSNVDGDLTGEVFKKDISVVYYDDFGAVGDGVADDFKAVYETHKFANECGQTVKADGKKTYRLFDTRMGGDEPIQVQIKTSVDWCGANFIIDDTPFNSDKDSPLFYLNYNKHLFAVDPDEEHEMIELTDPEVLKRLVEAGINTETKNIKIDIPGWDGPLMISPYDTTNKLCRRTGYLGLRGSDMHEVILLDKDGNVSEDTPIVYNYKNLTSVEVYRLDKSTAITIENGTFTSKVCHFNTLILDAEGKEIGRFNTMFSRGFRVQRSYTTLKNIKHYVTNEVQLYEQVTPEGNIVMAGMGYSSFYSLASCTDVLIKDCVMTGRRNYRTTTNRSMTGTVDMAMGKCCNILVDGCKQSNFWITVDPETYEITTSSEYTPGAVPGMSFVEVYGKRIKLCWGVMSSNYCKNMEYRNSTLSRFDAHAPIVNGKIVNCNINDIELNGNGKFILENVNWYPYLPTTPLFFLRGDYGCTWDGDVIVKNVNAYLQDDNSSPIVYHKYANWFRGYTCAFPNVLLDNLALYSVKTGEPLPKGHKMNITTIVEDAKRMHLNDCGLPSRFCVLDEDGDGYIDEPLIDINRDGKYDEKDRVDLDGDGKIGNTSLRYADYCDENGKPNKTEAVHPTSTANLNIVKPPKYIKVVNNKSGAVYTITDTSGEGVSDGAWYDDEERFGGFYGDTKFIYGEGEDEFFVGPDKNQTKTDSFIFVSEYYK